MISKENRGWGDNITNNGTSTQRQHMQHKALIISAQVKIKIKYQSAILKYDIDKYRQNHGEII